MPNIGYYVIDENEISYGIKDKQFTLYLQPIINVLGESFETLEVFIRWNHPLLGALPPSLFMPRMKTESVQTALTYYIIEESFNLHKLSILSGKEIGININMNKAEICHPKTLMSIKQEMMSSCMETGHNICLELSPQIFHVEHQEDFIDAPIALSEYPHLEQLKQILQPYLDLGITLALDTCDKLEGAIYRASFLGLHAIKMPAKILQEVIYNNDHAYLEKCVSLAKEKDIVIIGTGIENEEHIRLCLQYHIDYLQGMKFCNAVVRQDLQYWDNGILRKIKTEISQKSPRFTPVSQEQQKKQQLQEQSFSDVILEQHKKPMSFRDSLPPITQKPLELIEVLDSPLHAHKDSSFQAETVLTQDVLEKNISTQTNYQLEESGVKKLMTKGFGRRNF